jgi:hypothetical protein
LNESGEKGGESVCEFGKLGSRKTSNTDKYYYTLNLGLAFSSTGAGYA